MASDRETLGPFRDLFCLGEQHEEFHGEALRKAQVWPWDLAQRVALGVTNVLKKRPWQQSKIGSAISTECTGGTGSAMSPTTDCTKLYTSGMAKNTRLLCFTVLW